MSFDLDDRCDVIIVDREPPATRPDLPPHPDDTAEMFCPRCGDRLTFDVRDEYMPLLGRTVAIVDGGGWCEDCDQDDALDRMRAERPWLFAEPGIVDEHDVMGQDWQAGIDVYELVR